MFAAQVPATAPKSVPAAAPAKDTKDDNRFTLVTAEGMNKLFKQAKKDDAVHEVSALFFAFVRRSLPPAGCAEKFRAESGQARRPTVEAARQFPRMSWQVGAEVPAESVAEVWFSSVC